MKYDVNVGPFNIYQTNRILYLVLKFCFNVRLGASKNIFDNTGNAILQNRILITYYHLTILQDSIVNLDMIRNHTFIVTKQNLNISKRRNQPIALKEFLLIQIR